MATCDITLPSSGLVLGDGSLDVLTKYQSLTDASFDIDSIYMRAKDTFKELLDSKKINESEYAQLAAQFVSTLAVQTTQVAMQTAVQWAKEERDGVYTQSNLMVQSELILAQRERTKFEICKLQKETELQCAQIKATISTSIRENGTIASLAADGCTPTALNKDGVKYAQLETLKAQSYATLSDAYRKSGVVTIGTSADGFIKGTAGDDAGYTKAQTDFALRQIKSFEDSKRSHAANAVSQLIGQLLASEIAPSGDYVAQWNAALNYLNTNTP